MILSKSLRFNAWSVLFVVLLAFSLSSCRDDKFDEPPINGADPALTVNMTIDSLKTIYRDTVLNDEAIVTIDKDWIIAGVVIADDKSGNFYKSVVIDDETAGISVRIDLSNFNTDYPIGRKLFIKLKGLVLGQYAGMMQLGGYIDVTDPSRPEAAAIPSSLVSNFVFGGTWNNPVVAHEVSIGDLGNTFKWQNRLIKLSNVQFISADTAETWADQVTLSSINRTITDCYSAELLVRTSGYSSFAAKLTPTGSGSITAIFSVFSSDKQLIIRDVYDVDMNLGRFVVGTCPPPPAVLTSIANVRAEYSGSSTAVSAGKKIVGIVISDYTSNNSDTRNMFIQDGTAGIVVRFTSSHTFNLGDSVEVNVGGQTLSEFNGLLQVGGSTPNVPLVNATKLGTGTVSPRVVTLAQVVANMSSTDSWESTLIQVTNPPTPITFSAPTFSTTTNMIDGTGTVLMYTRTQASFSGTTITTPANAVTCIVSDFNGVQLFVRNASDVQ
jgi:hypothetical protein